MPAWKRAEDGGTMTFMDVVDAFTVDDLSHLRYGGGRYELIDGALWITHGDFTSDTLAELPDDGHRHELIDGALLVTPSPLLQHQRISSAVWRVLDDHCPTDHVAVQAPFDVRLNDETTVQPDVLVARAADLTPRFLQGPPVLAVEVLSRTTRLFDLGTKKDIYAESGCPSYWVIDPEPSRLIAWDLRDGEYVQVTDVTGAESWTAESPFAVTITPSDLLG
jgi:Uma2 family endonuclease